MPRTQSLITFPVEISSPGTMTALQETHWLGFACQLLETKLLQLMRFKFGEVCQLLLAQIALSCCSDSVQLATAHCNFGNLKCTLLLTRSTSDHHCCILNAVGVLVDRQICI